MADSENRLDLSGDHNQIGSIQQTIVNEAKPHEWQCPVPTPHSAPFGGRDDEQAELVGWLLSGQDAAISAVQAQGGMGKTSLARVLAHKLYTDQQVRAVIWADVNPAPSAATILARWAQQYGGVVLDVANQPLEALASQTRDLLHKTIETACKTCEPPRVLMVLDNVWDDGKATVNLLKQAAPPHCTILITTRSAALATDLNIVRVKKLDRLRGQAAVQMLRKLFDDTLTATDTQLEALATSLGGHPLALTLAARYIRKGADPTARLVKQTKQFTEGIAAEMSFKKLQLEQGDEKDDNLTLALSYSYLDVVLTDDDRTRFRALGVLAHDAPFDDALLAALWGMSEEEVEDAVDTLRNRALLELDKDSRGYRLHPLLRSYARALLTQADELDAAFTHYATHMTTVAKQFDSLSFEQWTTLDAQLPHLHAVGDALAVQVLDAEPTAERLALAGEFSWNTMRYLGYRPAALFTEEGDARTPSRIRWFEVGLAAWRAVGNPAREAATLHNIGSAWSDLGEARRALAFYEQALPMHRAVGNRNMEATTLHNIGVAWDALGEKRRALEFYEQALPLRRAVGDRRVEATTLNNIGFAWDALGEKRRALAFYEQALPTLRAVGDRWVEATTLNNIGFAWSALGEARRALAFYEQALPLSRAVGDRRVEATTLHNIGGAWDVLGEKRRALEFYEQALPMHRAVGNRTMEATTLNNIGLAWDALGEKRRALEFYEQALPVFRAVGDRRGEATTLNNIGYIYFQNGDLDKTIDIQHQIVEIFRSIGAVWEEALILLNTAVVYQRLGRIEEAIAAAQAGRDILIRYNLPQNAGGDTLAHYDALIAQLNAHNKTGFWQRLFGRR